MTLHRALGERMAVPARFLVLMSASLGIVGVAGHFLGWPLMASTLGPTGYVFASHPGSEEAKRRNAVVGHGITLAVGLFCLAVFGLWHHPFIAQQGHLVLTQVGAAALAGALTIALLEVVGAHHAPAGATALLVATGLAKPGPPLYGLVLGLAFLIVVGPELSRRFPLARRQTEDSA